MAHIMNILEETGVLQMLNLHQPVLSKLMVQWPGSGAVQPGENVPHTPLSMAPPQLTTDLQASGPQDPCIVLMLGQYGPMMGSNSFCHWLVANVPIIGPHVAVEQGIVLSPYKGPMLSEGPPNSGNFVFLLLNPKPGLQVSPEVLGSMLRSNASPSGALNIGDFLQNANLDVVAATVLRR